MRTKHRQLPLSTHQPRALLRLSSFHSIVFSNSAQWYHGATDVMSVPVWFSVSLPATTESSSLLTAVSRAGNMQINRVKGYSLLIVTVWNLSQLLFKATLESQSVFSLLFGMQLNVELVVCACIALVFKSTYNNNIGVRIIVGKKYFGSTQRTRPHSWRTILLLIYCI